MAKSFTEWSQDKINKQHEHDFAKIKRHAKIAAGKLTQQQRDFIMDVSNDKNLVAYTKKTTIQISAGTVLHVPQGNGDFMTKPLNTNVFKNLLLSGLFEIDHERESFMPHTKRYRFSKLGMEIADEVCGRNQRRDEETRIQKFSDKLDAYINMSKKLCEPPYKASAFGDTIHEIKVLSKDVETVRQRSGSQFERDAMQRLHEDIEATLHQIISVASGEQLVHFERPSKVRARANNKEKLEKILKCMHSAQEGNLKEFGEADTWADQIKLMEEVIATL